MYLLSCLADYLHPRLCCTCIYLISEIENIHPVAIVGSKCLRYCYLLLSSRFPFPFSSGRLCCCSYCSTSGVFMVVLLAVTIPYLVANMVSVTVVTVVRKIAGGESGGFCCAGALLLLLSPLLLWFFVSAAVLADSRILLISSSSCVVVSGDLGWFLPWTFVLLFVTMCSCCCCFYNLFPILYVLFVVLSLHVHCVCNFLMSVPSFFSSCYFC